MLVPVQDKLSLMLWWVIACGVTAYLALGIFNTLVVILQ